MIRTPSTEFNARSPPLSNGVRKSLKDASASHSHRQQPRPRPTSSRATSTNARPSSSNGHDPHHQDGVEAAKHPTVAQAPGASFSVATKPQDRDPSLLRRPPSQQQQNGFDGLSSYQLDHNGRIPANDFNYVQRDKLVASAQQSAIRSGNLHWVALMDLAHLASQHHLSPYSAMKFGPRGSPFAYIPITLQQPEVVKNTMNRQREEELQAKAWLIAKRERKLGRLANGADVRMDSHDDLPVLSLPADMFLTKSASSSMPSVGTKRPASLTTPPETRASSMLRTKPQQVERDLNEAMTDSMHSSSDAAPVEVMPPSSGEASSSSEDDSVLPAKPDQVDLSSFNRSTRMVEIGSSPDDKPAKNGVKGEQGTHEDGVADELMTSSQAGSSVEVGGPMDQERVMAQEMEQASATDKPAQPNGNGASKDASLGPLVHSTTQGNSTSDSTGEQQQQQQQQLQQHQLAMKTSDTHPIHISPILPDELLASVGRRIRSTAESQLLRLELTASGEGTSSQQQQTSLTERYFEDHSREQIQGTRLIRLRNMLDLHSVTSTDPSANYLSQSQLAEQAAKESKLTLTDTISSHNQGAIGNLLLSSCPGKKVRLSGPVRGRGAICRDLGLDLTRIHSIGVRAVVCCLNDEELSFLGAPWEEYEREADRLGLDVYRLPMAEGFAPTNVEEMDATMTSIVQDCTLKGTNVLVHCRGGVGRAGLIACSWLLKMGFVGEGKGMEGLEEGQKCNEIVERTTTSGSHNLIAGETGKDGDDLYATNGSGTVSGKQEDELHSPNSNGTVSKEDGLSEEQEEAECEAILSTVKSLVETIRRRRSPKAIETAEQVRFLVEYVTFLHRQERLKANRG
ncbi:hypothetical protein PHSY_005340 [Pseudozyma hubeiensis SY62]|uniref:Tyrosine specific protein phosphatases domain-containing protein n=1 Tax=Pseudozyma hubeiensis (strain SY62) TaxID=1305764 RepID=R9P8P4_PSEHS|nr:hypothetical protein PHSY_005340 [Pseudozyma hubeiensis SY62]GAC97753.1 hypothetical protein PHSY_005340 [Pseudozyma hubeiensis SY62]